MSKAIYVTLEMRDQDGHWQYCTDQRYHTDDLLEARIQFLRDHPEYRELCLVGDAKLVTTTVPQDRGYRNPDCLGCQRYLSLLSDILSKWSSCTTGDCGTCDMCKVKNTLAAAGVTIKREDEDDYTDSPCDLLRKRATQH